MKLAFSIIILFSMGGAALRAQTPQASPSPNAETLDWCKAQPAYDLMLRDTKWKHANDLYQILLALKTRVTPEQHANIKTILLSMVYGPRKPDTDSLEAVTSDFL